MPFTLTSFGLTGSLYGPKFNCRTLKTNHIRHDISLRLKKTEINGYNQTWCYGPYNNTTHEWLSCDSCLDKCINEPKNNHMKAKDAIKLSNENSAKQLDIIYGRIKISAEQGQRSVRVSVIPGLKGGTIRQLEEDGYEVLDETLHGLFSAGRNIYVIHW